MNVTTCTKISLVPRSSMEWGYAKMALDTCPVDQVARNFNAQISEVRLYFWPKLAAILNTSHTFSWNSNKLCNRNKLDSCLWTNILLFASSYPETIFTIRVRTNDSRAGLTDIQLVSESLVFNRLSTRQAVGNIKNSMRFSIRYILQ